MGHSQAEKAATHQRIVDVAARRFRELGLDGIGVADVMKEAGMTVGGFYKHFESRDELVTEALEVAFKSLDVWEGRAENLAQAVRDYLSEAHRDAPGQGCALGALLGDVGRSNDATREVFTERVKHNLAFSEGLLDIADPAERRARAMLQLSACLGAIGLARARKFLNALALGKCSSLQVPLIAAARDMPVSLPRGTSRKYIRFQPVANLNFATARNF